MKLSNALMAAIDAPFPEDKRDHVHASLRYLFRGLANDVADVLPDGCSETEVEAIALSLAELHQRAVRAAERAT